MYKLDGYQIYLDCVVTSGDHKHELIFASVYGGETSIKKWLGAIENNHKTFEYAGVPNQYGCHKDRKYILVRDKRNLYSKRQKVQNETYENFLHSFVYDKYVHQIDGEVISHVLVEDGQNVSEQLWQRIKDMTATPVIDTWQDQIIEQLTDQGKIIKNNVHSVDDNLLCYSIYFGSQFDLNEVVLDLLKDGLLALPA